MVKVIKTLKKENELLKGKCENSDIALVKLIEEVLLFAIADCAETECSVETIVFDNYISDSFSLHLYPLPCVKTSVAFPFLQVSCFLSYVVSFIFICILGKPCAT